MVLAAVAAGVLWIMSNEDTRAEIADWLVSQLGSTPTPAPVVVYVADTPTPTVTPTPPVPTTVVLAPTATPTPQPTPSPTAEPTATAIPIPTSVPLPEYSIDDVGVKLAAVSDGVFNVDLSVSFRNVSAGAGRGPVELLMSVDGDEPELIAVIPSLATGESETFVFSREFSPGRYTVTFTAGDARVEVPMDVAPATAALVVPTPTPAATATPEPTETPTPHPTATLTPAPIPTATPTYEPTSTPHPTPTPTAPAVVSDSDVAPHLRHLEYKQYMLELINEERTRAGLGAVVLGDNNAAQLHAEASLEHCFLSHWGIDGLKPYMRYSLAGGYQSNGENGRGHGYCIVASDGYRAIASIEEEVRDAMEGWMNSSGHRENILRPWHRKVNIGLAWDRYNLKAYQHFEGDYVEYNLLPSIQDGHLSMSGTVMNGAQIEGEIGLGVQLYYDPPPYPLTRGQLGKTYCYDSGTLIAALRRPPSGNSYYLLDEFTTISSACRDPYDVAADTPAPRPSLVGHLLQRLESQLQVMTVTTLPWITATEWSVVEDQSFSVTADLGEIIKQHGEGVYTVLVWGAIAEEDAVISQYSIFHGVTPPDTYSVGVGDGQR